MSSYSLTISFTLLAVFAVLLGSSIGSWGAFGAALGAHLFTIYDEAKTRQRLKRRIAEVEAR